MSYSNSSASRHFTLAALAALLAWTASPGCSFDPRNVTAHDALGGAAGDGDGDLAGDGDGDGDGTGGGDGDGDGTGGGNGDGDGDGDGTGGGTGCIDVCVSQKDACAGACEGTCLPDIAAACDGICSGTCSSSCDNEAPDGSCFGTCDGICDGACLGLDEPAQCPGTCVDLCIEEEPAIGGCPADAEALCLAEGASARSQGIPLLADGNRIDNTTADFHAELSVSDNYGLVGETGYRFEGPLLCAASSDSQGDPLGSSGVTIDLDAPFVWDSTVGGLSFGVVPYGASSLLQPTVHVFLISGSDVYCAPIASGQAGLLTLDQFQQTTNNDWTKFLECDGSLAPISLTVEQISFQVRQEDSSMNFCLTDLAVVPEAELTGYEPEHDLTSALPAAAGACDPYGSFELSPNVNEVTIIYEICPTPASDSADCGGLEDGGGYLFLCTDDQDCDQNPNDTLSDTGWEPVATCP